MKNGLTRWAGILGAAGFAVLALGRIPLANEWFGYEVFVGPNGERIISTAPIGAMFIVLSGLAFVCLGRCASTRVKRLAWFGLVPCLWQAVGILLVLQQTSFTVTGWTVAANCLDAFAVNVLLAVALWELAEVMPRQTRFWGYAAAVSLAIDAVWTTCCMLSPYVFFFMDIEWLVVAVPAVAFVLLARHGIDAAEAAKDVSVGYKLLHATLAFLPLALLQGLLSLNLSHKVVAESPCEQVVEEAAESGESETDAD